MSKILRATIAVALFFGLGSAVRADEIHLTSGGVVRGKVVKKNSRELVVKTLSGTMVVPRDEIDKIVKGESVVEKYRKKLRKINKKDAEARYSLGLWLKSKKAHRYAKKEFKRTIELDPEHRFAREELGYVRKDGQWVLRNAKPASAGKGRSGARSRAKQRRRGFRFATPVSEQLGKALGNIRKKKLETRRAAWSVIRDGKEVERLMKVLTAEKAPGQAKVRSAVIKHAPEAVDASGEALRPHVESYVSKVVEPAVTEALKSYVRARLRAHKRAAKRIAKLIKDWRADKPGTAALTKRTKALEKWVKHRDAALKVIFDTSIYPDANHGKSGQPTVDEHVDKVKAVWPKFDLLVKKDVAKFLALTPKEAGEYLSRLQRPLTMLQEAKRVLAKRPNGGTVELPGVAAVYEVLISYQAGKHETVSARAGELNAWEQELLRRVRDETVRAYNLSFKRKNPHKYGVKPAGDEVEQVRFTNDYRIMMGRVALEIDPRLVDSARGHSADMTRLGFFAHESPVAGKRSPFNRMAKAGYSGGAGENISMGYSSPKAAHIGWYNSSGHHRNILGRNHRALGSGRDGKHWTQNFGSAGVLAR